jgi:hypothetical protein
MIAPAMSEVHGETDAAAGETNPRTTEDSGLGPLKPLLHHLAEARRQLNRCLAIEWDLAQLPIRRAGLYAGLAFFGAAIGLTVIIVATVLFLLGVCHGLSQLLGQNDWAGELVTGGGILALTAGGIWAASRYSIKTSLQRTIAKYASNSAEQ